MTSSVYTTSNTPKRRIRETHSYFTRIKNEKFLEETNKKTTVTDRIRLGILLLPSSLLQKERMTETRLHFLKTSVRGTPILWVSRSVYKTFYTHNVVEESIDWSSLSERETPDKTRIYIDKLVFVRIELRDFFTCKLQDLIPLGQLHRPQTSGSINPLVPLS